LPGTRNVAAQTLLAFIASDPTRSGDPTFLVIGDLNSHAQEDSIRPLDYAPVTSLVSQVIRARATLDNPAST